MLYKEWKTVRIKLLIWIAVYLGGAGIFIIEQGGFNLNHSFNIPLFVKWQGFSALVMAIVAGLGGVDLAADEKANATLGFLLSKPISRSQIYLSKLGVNIAALAVAFLPVNLLILAVDQFNPTGISEKGRTSQACMQNLWEACTQQIQETAESANLLKGLAVIGMIMIFGVGIVCMTGLISIFAGNIMQAILFAVPALVVFVGFVSISVIRLGPSSVWGINFFSTVTLATPLLLLMLSGGFFYIGLVTFQRKEF